MIQIRKSNDRGRGHMSWLDSRFSFSFADYYDPGHEGFGSLRVLNEDWIAPGSGFGSHAHRDMEILTWVLEGVLEHRDSQGNTSQIRPGRVQLMRAGRGIVHSEMNPSPDETTHLLQIWLHPERKGMAPHYEEMTIQPIDSSLTPIASRHGQVGGVSLAQDATIHAARVSGGHEIIHALNPGRRAWVQVTRGRGLVADRPVEAGDGAALTSESEVRLQSEAGLEALIFDLA